MASWPEPADSDHRWPTTMTPGENQTTAESGAGIEIVSMPAELDLTTSEDVAEQGCAAIARLARLLLLDLTACRLGSQLNAGTMPRRWPVTARRAGGTATVPGQQTTRGWPARHRPARTRSARGGR
jgi:hypothetical protein